MDERLRIEVRQRAAGRCEYCRFPEAHAFLPFQADHIIAEKHHGPTIDTNLAWSCYYCNSYKGPNIAGWDRVSEVIVRLYHPRQDRWMEHFRWDGPYLAGITVVGQVTIDVLNMNHPDVVAVRRVLLQLGYSL